MAATYRNHSEETGSLTAGKPTGTADGDILVAFFASFATTAHGGPAGWTSLHTHTVGTLRQSVWWKVAASEPSTWAWSGPAAASSIIAVVAVQGGDTVSPINVSNQQANTGSATVTAPTITTTANGCCLVWGAISNGGTITVPAGMTARWNQDGGDDKGSTENQVTAGSTTRNGSVAATDNIAGLVAVAPVAAATKAPQPPSAYYALQPLLVR